MKKALLLLHGMGNFTAPGVDNNGNATYGSFGKEFIKASTESLQRYKKYRTKTLQEYVDIHEFNYDTWFDEMRIEMADNAKSMKDRLNAVTGIYGVTFATDLVGRLTDFETNFKDDEFFYTHWLDVIFYATILGAKVRVDVGRKIAGLVELYGQGNVNIMAHSLGTAVLHDTLHLLYRAESDPNDEIPDLDLTNHKLGSIWMVANVSCLVNSVTHLANPLTSVVKPGDDGCTHSFFNIRHEMDPFTWLSRFDPINNGSWISEKMYASAYKNIVTDLVVDVNTHSFTQYLQDPKVAENFLYQMTPFKVTVKEMDKVNRKYSKRAITGAYAALEETFRDLNVKDLESWRELLEAGRILNTAVENITNSLSMQGIMR